MLLRSLPDDISLSKLFDNLSIVVVVIYIHLAASSGSSIAQVDGLESRENRASCGPHLIAPSCGAAVRSKQGRKQARVYAFSWK